MTEQEIAQEILMASIKDSDVAKARKFLESFAYSTSALRALVEAMRQQYADAVTEGFTFEGTPCADILASILPAFAAAESQEV